MQLASPQHKNLAKSQTGPPPPQHQNYSKFRTDYLPTQPNFGIVGVSFHTLKFWHCGGASFHTLKIWGGASQKNTLYIRSTLIYFKVIFVIISVKKHQEISRFGPLVMREYVVEQCFYFRFLTFLRNFYTNVSIILINKQHLNL